MRRAKLGDVYYMKVPKGYKIFQWAYKIPKDGDYIRVFDGLYKEIPNIDNIQNIVNNNHSYIISYDVRKAYKIGLSIFIGNCLIPEKYPFPKYMVSIHNVDSNKFCLKINNREEWSDGGSFYVSSIEQLPKQYREVKLLNSYVPASWIMYLFDVDFDMTKLWLFNPQCPWDKSLEKYQREIEKMLDKDKL